MFNLVVLVSLSCVVGRGMATVVQLNSPGETSFSTSLTGIGNAGVSFGSDSLSGVNFGVDPGLTVGDGLAGISSVNFGVDSGFSGISGLNFGIDPGVSTGLSGLGSFETDAGIDFDSDVGGTISSFGTEPGFTSSLLGPASIDTSQLLQTDPTLINSGSLTLLGAGPVSSSLNSPTRRHYKYVPFIRRRHYRYHRIPKGTYKRHRYVNPIRLLTTRHGGHRSYRPRFAHLRKHSY